MYIYEVVSRRLEVVVDSATELVLVEVVVDLRYSKSAELACNTCWREDKNAKKTYEVGGRVLVVEDDGEVLVSDVEIREEILVDVLRNLQLVLRHSEIEGGHVTKLTNCSRWWMRRWYLFLC